MSSTDNDKSLSAAKKIENFLFRGMGWISFFIILAFVFFGFSIFYFNAWLTVNSAPGITQVEPFFNWALWQEVIADINQRSLAGTESPAVRDIFK